MKTSAQKEPINFVWGKPAPSLLPVAELAYCVQDVLADPVSATDALEYGDPAGPATLRQQVADSLAEFYGTPNSAKEICITGGASQGLSTILQVLTDPLQTVQVWLVAPCFHLASRVFEDAGFTGKLRAVPETDDGIDLEGLERSMLQQESANALKSPRQSTSKPEDLQRKTYAHIIYIVPSFSNPSGRTLPLSHRHQLVSLARRFDALIISDDIYDYLAYPPTENAAIGDDPDTVSLLPRLVDIDRELPAIPTDPHGFGHALSNGSFSKLIGPGVRTGWISASPSVTQALINAGASVAGGCPSQLGSAIVSRFIASGYLTSHVKHTIVPAYSRRRRLMVAAVQEFLHPLGAQVVKDYSEGHRSGGFYLWLRLPNKLDGGLVAQKCAELESLAVWPGEAFEIKGDPTVKLSSYLRLCFSWAEEDKIGEGILRLSRVVDLMLNGEHGAALEAEASWRNALWKANTNASN
ncbi:Valine--pyruvate aminotransferase [Conoideocrella luteorostrata]|uniref:Valine--pyruvate aminotransferase n=1 Tax=Conoideocrella luteorostrata TaxID=1105319 RepID=A0AAJ0CYY4_9HYPO|nr:Valine--pyruvate aminotransferase [Conoideocrella luteorostrata]